MSSAPPPVLTPEQMTPEYQRQSTQPTIIGVGVLWAVLMTLTTVARYYARHLQKRKFIWGDVWVGIAYFFGIANVACELLCVRFGAGLHQSTLSAENVKDFAITIFYAVPFTYLFAATFPKLAVLDIYLNIFTDKPSRIIIWITVAILIANLFGNLLPFAAQCEPVAYLWDKSIPGGHCQNIQQHFFWASIPNIVTDVVILLLPGPLVWKLQASKKTKLGIFLTFLLGSLGLITSIIRFVEYNFQYIDITWDATTALVWSTTEPSVYLLCANCLTYRVLFKRLQESRFGTYTRRYLISWKGSSNKNGSKSTKPRGNFGTHLRVGSTEDTFPVNQNTEAYAMGRKKSSDRKQIADGDLNIYVRSDIEVAHVRQHEVV